MQSGGEEEQRVGGKERQWAVWRGWARGHVPAAWLMKPRRLPTCSQAGCRWPPELEGSGGRRGARPAMRHHHDTLADEPVEPVEPATAAVR